MRIPRHFALALLSTAFVWLSVGLLAASGAIAALDRALYDRILSVSPAPAAPDDVVIVAIDAPSFQEIGRPWPWPRATHAALVDAARSAGAREIVFDIIFDQPTPDDERFAEAMAAFGSVVLASERSVQRTRYGDIDTLIGPHGALREAARAVGRSDIPIDPDGRARRMPHSPDALAYAVDGAGAVEAGALIRWRDPSSPIRRVSYYQALNPDEFLPPGALEDAILFVGLALDASPVVRAAQTDRLAAPISYGGSPFVTGVETHVQAFATSRAGDALFAAPRWAAMLAVVLAVASTIAGAWLLSARPALSIGLQIGGAAAAAITGYAAIVGAGLWIALAAPIGGLAGSGVAHGALAFVRARAERAKLARGLSSYVAPAVLQRVLRDPSALNLGGERREVTTLITDLEGFTALMEHIDAARQAAILRDYLGGVSATVLAAEGMIAQFVGDAVVALFNAPAEQPDHALRAIACAIAIDRFAQAYRKRLSADGIALGVTRIGVESGLSLVGNFGTSERFHYSAMGDVTNVASRLEGANKTLGTRILVGPGAAALSRASLRPAARLHVPGRDGPIDAFAPVHDVTEEALGAYNHAYRALSEGAPDVAEAFAAAQALAPGDRLIAFHRERLERGVTGPDVETTKG